MRYKADKINEALYYTDGTRCYHGRLVAITIDKEGTWYRMKRDVGFIEIFLVNSKKTSKTAVGLLKALNLSKETQVAARLLTKEEEDESE